LAHRRATREQWIESPFANEARDQIGSVGRRLGEAVRAEVAGQGVPADDVQVHVRAHIRYSATDTALVMPAFDIPPRQTQDDPIWRRASRSRLPLPGGERGGVRGTGPLIDLDDRNPLTRRPSAAALSPPRRGKGLLPPPSPARE